MQSEKDALIEEYAVAAFNHKDAQLPMYVWRQHFVEFADKLAALSAAEPVAAMTTDYLGCEYVSMDVAGIEKIAAAHSKGPTEVVYLYAAPPAPSAAVKALQMADETFRNLGWHDKHEATTAALAALSAQVQDVAGWQSIETAPKDGTLIIVSNRYGAWLAKYIETFPTGYRPANPWFVMLLNMQHMSNSPNYIPTHWMPLPSAPAAPAKQEGGHD